MHLDFLNFFLILAIKGHAYFLNKRPGNPVLANKCKWTKNKLSTKII
jgi:hypothetical protein